jgi:hypothetical protein
LNLLKVYTKSFDTKDEERRVCRLVEDEKQHTRDLDQEKCTNEESKMLVTK